MRTTRFFVLLLTLTLCTSAWAQPSSPGVEPSIGIWKWGKTTPPPPPSDDEVFSEEPEDAQTSLERLKAERGIEEPETTEEDNRFFVMAWIQRFWNFLWGKESTETPDL